MTFDVYSHKENGTKGVLLIQRGNNLLYQNTESVDEETSVITKIPKGQSYELVSDESILSVDFESNDGAGDGVSEFLLLCMLIDRAEAKCQSEPTDQNQMYLRSLLLAKDALKIK